MNIVVDQELNLVHQPKTCPTCNGSGQVRVQRQTPLGSFVTTSTCDKCGGKGKIVEKPCSSCRGKGKARKNRKIKVNIPAGVDTGNVMPLRGQGEHGTNGGSSRRFIYKNKCSSIKEI